MKKIAWLAGVLALVACGSYVFVYLYRWEWNRALIMAAFFLATEVALATALVLRALAERREGDAAPPDPSLVRHLRETAPRRDHFAWLGVRGGRTSVFITMVVGGGVLVSGLAWALDRVAGRTAGRRMEGELARRLEAIAFPSEGLLADETELLAERVPFEDDPDLRLLLGTPSPG